jgi:hypothetical protein
MLIRSQCCHECVSPRVLAIVPLHCEDCTQQQHRHTKPSREARGQQRCFVKLEVTYISVRFLRTAGLRSFAAVLCTHIVVAIPQRKITAVSLTAAVRFFASVRESIDSHQFDS